MAIRPCAQFFQEDGNIKRSVSENRMRQAAMVAALVMAVHGVASIISTQNFSTQN